MDFSFSEEQEMLKKTARAFLTEQCPRTLVRRMEADDKGFPAELWREMAELGWMALVFPKKCGGFDLSFLELSVLLEEMGRACVPGPFFSTVVLGGLVILDIGNEKQKHEYLPKIARGETIITLALAETGDICDASSVKVRAFIDRNDYVIDGTKLFVPDALIADAILCVARTCDGAIPEEGISMFIVPARIPGMRLTRLDTIAEDKLYEVVFDQVRVPKEGLLGEPGQAWTGIQKALERAAIAKCCEMVGGAQQVLEMTLDYVGQRRQFGQPLGNFQPIQDRCADMAVDLDTSRLMTYEAVWKLSQGLPCAAEASMAKAWVSDAYRRITYMALQVMGGVAFMADHDMTLYFRRAKAAALNFGNADFHRENVARQLRL